MLIAAVLLGVGIIMLSVKLVSRREVTAVSTGNTQTGADDENVIILLTEAEEKTPEKQTETESETQTEAVTEKETQTEKALTRPETETSTEKAAEKSSEKTTEKPQPETRRTAAVETEAETQKETQGSAVVTAPQTTVGTEDAGEDHPEPADTDTGSVVTAPETKEAEIDTLVMASADKYADTESNVRSGPGTEYDIVGGLNRGDSVHITGQTDNWYRIQTDNGTGYVSKSLLVDEYTPTYATIVSTCYVRSNDDYGDNIIMEVYGGTTVEVLSNPGGWAYISVDGVTGYVGSQFLG